MCVERHRCGTIYMKIWVYEQLGLDKEVKMKQVLSYSTKNIKLVVYLH